jgi:hypothetical protein
MKFYSYLYLDENRIPFYAGCGSKKRSRDRHLFQVPPRERIQKFFHNTEDEAFAHEMKLIATYGRQDNGTGILLNRTDGGRGHSNPGPVTRELMRRHGTRMVPKLHASVDHHYAAHVRWHTSRNRSSSSCQHCAVLN